jgi:hypothetical protein
MWLDLFSQNWLQHTRCVGCTTHNTCRLCCRYILDSLDADVMSKQAMAPEQRLQLPCISFGDGVAHLSLHSLCGMCYLR